MPFHSLQSFAQFLESKNHLVRVKAEVDPVLEITEIASRVFEQKGPALLFENVKGSKFPIIINTLGTEERVRWALGRHPETIGEELKKFAEGMMPPSPKKLWDHRSTIKRVLKMKPARQWFPPIKQNKIAPADLTQLPVAQSWPLDGGKFFTFPLVITKSPITGKQNMGVYRMHLYGKNQTGMHWQIGKGGGYHYLEAESRNEPLSVDVVVGADPILMLCGVLPLPEGLDEMAFAGFLRGEGTKVTKLSSSNRVPAEAEFILQGFVPPHERRMEGPYGDHFGHYSLAAPFPVFHVTKIWHRDGAMFPISVVGKPPQEDQVIGDAVQQMLLPLLKVMHPEIVDLWAYQEAGFHNLLVASVKQRFAKEAIKTGLWALGEGQLALSKCIILVDPDVNARDFKAVLRAIQKNFLPEKDFILLPGTSQDTLDFTSFKMNLGSKFILDATTSQTEAPGILFTQKTNLNDVRKFDPRIIDAVCLEETMLVVKVKSDGREILEKMLNSKLFSHCKMIAAVSSDIPLENPVLLLWGIFTRFDCERDTFFAKADIVQGHIRYSGPMAFDATWKIGYPEPLTMTPHIVDTVSRRWKEYGINL